MSKDLTDRYKLLESSSSVARKDSSSRDEDIQNFAESTMNELLAWYGYGDKAMRHVDHNTGQNASRDETDPSPRSKTRFLCSVTEALDANPPDLGQPISDSDRVGIQKRSPSSSASSQRHKDQFTRDVSSHSLDSTHSLVAGRHCRPDSVNSLTSTDSTESNLLASTKVPTREAADYSQNHQRHPAAMTKMKKVCDWCRQVPPSISLADSVDGLNQLSFCSDLCLNHYKMNLFCTETRQYLQQIQNSEDGGEVAVAASDNKILITPELWMAAEKKDGKRPRFNENQLEIRPDDSNYRLLDAERDDDVCRQSDCGSNVDTSNGMEFAEYLDQRKNKRKKEDKALLNSEISSEASFDVGKSTTARGVMSFEAASEDSAVHGAEERFSDAENGRRGKRFKTSTSKEAVSPASYPSAVASSLRKCLETQDGLSVAAKDSGSYSSPGSSRVRGGRSGVGKSDVFPLLHQATSADLSADPTQFRRSSDASNLVERSKSDVPSVNCLSSRQGKPNTPQFPTSPLFGSTAPLPATSLFSPPGIPSLMHLLGPTLNPQFLGAGAAVPPFPFLGIPSLFSMPGGGGTGGVGGGVQMPPGIPVPPPVTNPWSSLLPPNTLMIPYPVLLPLPIPIPIPFPVPAKCGGGQPKSAGEKSDTCSSRQNDGGKTDPREDFKEKAGDLRLPPKSQDKSDSFPNHTIVCTCCRKESTPGRPPHDPPSRSNFCSPCRNEKRDAQHASSFPDNPNVPALFAAASVASQNLAIDFSMARDSKNSMRSPSVQGTTSFAATPSSVTIKTEPLDLAISGENNNLSSSSPSSASSSLMMKSSCESLQSLPPSLPYLARRSLILDAPSISKEKPVHAEKHFADASSKKFMYCKRRYPSLHIKTK